MEQYLFAINTSSIAFLAVYCALVIFRFQWLRKEVDDYRGRVINILTVSRASLSEDNRLRAIAIRDSKIAKSNEELFDLDDNALNEYTLKMIKIEKKEEDRNLLVCDLSLGEGLQSHTLKHSHKLFQKRHKRLKELKNHFIYSSIALLFSFFVSLALMGDFLTKFNIEDQCHRIFVFIFYSIYILGIFTYMFFDIKKDYE